MTVPREQLRDGAMTLSTYTFAINHDTEQGDGRTRSLQRSAPTRGVSGAIDFIRQQGEATPKVIRTSGTILETSQFEALTAYFDACENRTVFYTDVDGDEHEVLISTFDTNKVRGVNRRGGLPYYWTYRLEMEVVT